MAREERGIKGPGRGEREEVKRIKEAIEEESEEERKRGERT